MRSARSSLRLASRPAALAPAAAAARLSTSRAVAAAAAPPAAASHSLLRTGDEVRRLALLEWRVPWPDAAARRHCVPEDRYLLQSTRPARERT